VLVVDDEAPIRLLCRVNLQIAGMEVEEAEDGGDALRVLEAETVDLVLLDVMMPNLDGWEVAERLAASAETRDLPVVFLTARVGDDDRQRAFELDAVGYVVKPFDPIELAGKVRDVLHRVAMGEREQLNRELSESE
jgi:DNA-binding response OmpR family regulator